MVLSEFEPFSSSGINRLSFFKNFLEQQGHFVAVLTTLTSAQGIKKNKTYDLENNIYRAFSLSLLQRRLLSSRRLPIYPTLALEGKYDVWIPFAINKGLKLVKELSIDIILSSFPDFNSIHVAEKIATLTSTKLMTDLRDPPYWIYDNIIPNRKNKHCKNLFTKVINNSDKIITCTQQSKESLTKYYNINQTIEVIGNGYDANIISKLGTYKARNDNFFEIVHIGSFYNEGRDIRPVVKVLEKQSNKLNLKIKLRLIGDSPDQKTIIEINKIAKSITISIEPPVPAIEALSIAKQSDLLLLLQGNRFDRQIPAKVYEYLALNRPIWAVIGINGATHQLLKDYANNVEISDYNNEFEIESSVLSMYKMKPKPLDCNVLSRQEQTKSLNKLFADFRYSSTNN